MADWATISALATAGGTLALAGATYASVRSANRSARLAEVALQEQRRPVLVHSRPDDRVETIDFIGGHRVSVPGGGAAVEAIEGVVFLVLSLRNVGAGIAVLQGWYYHDEMMTGNMAPPPPADEFRLLTRDQYIASGETGVFQAAIRDSTDPLHPTVTAAAMEEHSFSLDLLYTDQVGGQRTISRFGVLSDEDGWIGAIGRHWYLDAAAPR